MKKTLQLLFLTLFLHQFKAQWTQTSNLLYPDMLSWDVGIGTNSPSAKLHVKGTGTTSSTYPFKVVNNSDIPSMEIKDDGRVYVGDPYPFDNGLMILGTGNNPNVDQRMISLSLHKNISDRFMISWGNLDPGKFQIGYHINDGTMPNHARLLTIETDGNTGIGTNDPVNRLDVKGKVAIGSNYAGSAIAPADGMIVEGNVGIGTTNPLSPLDVDGASLLIRAFDHSTSNALTNPAGLYFRSQFSPGAPTVTTSPPDNYLRNMSIRPRNGCESSGLDGLEINGYSGLMFTTGYYDRMLLDQYGSLFLGPSPWPSSCTSGVVTLAVNGNINYTGTLSHVSDARFKKDIKTMSNAIDMIKKLRPTTYYYDKEKFANRAFPETKSYGFIAQELKEVLPELTSTDGEGYYMVNYISLIPILTQAIKEQQALLEENKNEIEALKQQIVGSGNKLQSVSALSDNSETGAILHQNMPNPFDYSTTIKYFIPETIQKAVMLIFDLNGRQLKSFPINDKGHGKLSIKASELPEGMYYYSLIVDGKEVGTKQMIISNTR